MKKQLMDISLHHPAAFPLKTLLGLAWILSMACSHGAPNASKQTLTNQSHLFSEYQTDILPILVEYCYDCHMDGSEEGGLDFDHFQSLASMTEDRKTWLRVQEYLNLQLMPPEDKAQPKADEVSKIVSWINSAIFPVDPNNPDPGHVILRRLNVVEYQNTVRDLLHVESDLSSLLPPDDSGHGFDTVGGTLSISPSHIQKYLNAAETAISQLFQDLHYKNPVNSLNLQKITGSGIISDKDYLFMTNGQLKYKLRTTAPGDYKIQIKAYSTSSAGEHAKMQIQRRHTEIKTFEVKADKSSPEIYTIETTLHPSQQEISVHFLNDHYDPEQGTDRNLFIQEIKLIGPIKDRTKHVKQVFPERNHLESDESYALRILHPFANKAFRRPVSEEEVKPLLQFLQLAKRRGDHFEQGITLALQAILISPDFLFREESNGSPHETFRKAEFIDEHSLATRLSYFLWSTTPDQSLRELADKGELRANLSHQIQRMLKDPRSNELISNFAGQWLKLRDLETITPNPQLYPEATLKLRRVMRRETELFVADIIQNNGNILDFLHSDYTFLNDELARHYDIRGIDGSHFRKVTLPDQRRGGLMTHASILSLSSTPTRTSPVLRGQFVLENILDTPAPPPPPNIPSLLDDHADSETLGLREQLAIHREKPDCSGCHNLMDPIGLAFEHYDAIGRWRDSNQGKAIEPWGKLISGETFEDATQLRDIIYNTKQSDFLHCIISKLLTYSLGRGIEYYDKPALENIAHQVETNGFKAHTLIQAICESIPFQMKRIHP